MFTGNWKMSWKMTLHVLVRPWRWCFLSNSLVDLRNGQAVPAGEAVVVISLHGRRSCGAYSARRPWPQSLGPGARCDTVNDVIRSVTSDLENVEIGTDFVEKIWFVQQNLVLSSLWMVSFCFEQAQFAADVAVHPSCEQGWFIDDNQRSTWIDLDIYGKSRLIYLWLNQWWFITMDLPLVEDDHPTQTTINLQWIYHH